MWGRGAPRPGPGHTERSAGEAQAEKGKSWPDSRNRTRQAAGFRAPLSPHSLSREDTPTRKIHPKPNIIRKEHL